MVLRSDPWSETLLGGNKLDTQLAQGVKQSEQVMGDLLDFLSAPLLDVLLVF